MMNDDLYKFHAHRVCYSHEYIGDGTEYPYTYKGEQKEQIIEDMQMRLF